MSEEHQLPSDSDEDDEDYVPDGADEAVSEAESEGEAESGPEDENNENEQLTIKKKGKKRSRTSKKGAKRRKNLGADEEIGEGEENNEETKVLTEEEEKKRADSLWADFMKDTGTISTPKPQNSTNGTPATPIMRPKQDEKVKITKVFEFAGEEVKIEKEVSVDSAEARLSLLSSEKPQTPREDVPKPSGRGRGVKRGGLGGISSVLGQIGKKTKISTLEKSKLDWDTFKKQENLDEEITTHNRGRDGFLERQDFLQRADLRQFEIEKQLRTTTRRSTR